MRGINQFTSGHGSLPARDILLSSDWAQPIHYVSYHLHTEEQSDIHNFVLSEAQNISLLLRFP